MHIPFFNYKKCCKDINYTKLIEEALASGYLIGGPYVEELESKIEKFTSIKHCATVISAADAMEIIFDCCFLMDRMF